MFSVLQTVFELDLEKLPVKYYPFNWLAASYDVDRKFGYFINGGPKSNSIKTKMRKTAVVKTKKMQIVFLYYKCYGKKQKKTTEMYFCSLLTPCLYFIHISEKFSTFIGKYCTEIRKLDSCDIDELLTCTNQSVRQEVARSFRHSSNYRIHC